MKQTLKPSAILVNHYHQRDYLIIAYSHQEMSSFGIPVMETEQSDQSIFEMTDDDSVLAFERTSSFYVFVALWQIINDLAPFRATVYPRKKTVNQIRDESVPYIFSRNNAGDLNFYRQDHCLLLLTTEGKKQVLSVAARDRADVIAFCQRYDLQVIRLRESLISALWNRLTTHNHPGTQRLIQRSS